MPQPEFTQELRFAQKVGQQACDVLRAGEQAVTGITRKVGSDIVTATDLLSESLILDAINENYPDDAVLAEESGDRGGTSGRTWCIDPLDGTVNFASGIPYYGISIGLEDRYGSAVGAVFDPSTGQAFLAARETPTRFIGISAQRLGASTIDNAVLALQLPEMLWRQYSPLRELVESSRGWRVSGCVSLDMAWTAAGRFDLCIYRRTPERWDWCAGEALIASTPEKSVVTVGNFEGLDLMVAGVSPLADEVAERLIG